MARIPPVTYDRAHVQALLDRLVAHPWSDNGSVAMLVETPEPHEHVAREAVEVVEGQGFAGDHARKSFYRGALVPGREVSAISLEVLSVCGVDDPLVVGDNLITTDIGLHLLTPGDRVQVGTVVLARSPQPHQPCTVFRDRTSPEAFAVVSRGFRGALFTVERGGTLRYGDPIRVLGHEKAGPSPSSS